jgi:5-methylcytosine-specific restriction protein A
MPLLNRPKKQEKREYTSSKRDNANHHAVYNTGTWRKLRLWYLSEHPLCERCLKEKGKIQSAIDVHHKIEIDKGHTLMEKRTLGFDVENLESLCKDCHKEEHKKRRLNKFKNVSNNNRNSNF